MATALPIPTEYPSSRLARAAASMEARQHELLTAHRFALERTQGRADSWGYDVWQRRERELAEAIRYMPMPAPVGQLEIDIVHETAETVEIAINERADSRSGLEWGGATLTYALDDDAYPRLLSIQWATDTCTGLDLGECSLLGAYREAMEQADRLVWDRFVEGVR